MLKSVVHCSLTHKTRGYWKKLFKARYNDNYIGDQDHTNYEINLRRNIFEIDNEDIAIKPNIYPYLFGEQMQQYVVWIKDEKNDPGIDSLFDIINEIHPNMDIMVYINDPKDRSIKSILHYHAIVKNPSPPFHLQKLIILNSCRKNIPEIRVPLFDDMIHHLPKYESDPLLNYYTDITDYVENLLEIYELKSDFVIDSLFLESTNEKYQNISKIFADAFKMHSKSVNNVEFLDMENLALENDIADMNSIYHDLYQKYLNNITNLENMICLQNRYADLCHSNVEKIIALKYVCNLHDTIRTYQNVGINVNGFIDPHLQDFLMNAATRIYNYLCHCYNLIITQIIEDIINRMYDFDHHLIHCVTDYNLILTMAKHYGSRGGFINDLEIPDHLTSLRIEEWSDGIRKIYYNNWLLCLDNVN